MNDYDEVEQNTQLGELLGARREHKMSPAQLQAAHAKFRADAAELDRDPLASEAFAAEIAELDAELDDEYGEHAGDELLAAIKPMVAVDNSFVETNSSRDMAVEKERSDRQRSIETYSGRWLAVRSRNMKWKRLIDTVPVMTMILGAIVLAMFGSGSPATTIAGMFAATASATVVVQLAGRHRRERAVADMLHGAKGPVAMQIARGLYPRDSEVELAQIRVRMQIAERAFEFSEISGRRVDLGLSDDGLSLTVPGKRDR
ncbi:hypothetical protein QX204_34335 (plasmid) [Nocardia sp. PE-7]|uniref:hypothetical protein n=1 Tax=Nocardia sp. PE-7 TaxID=3058426 RepID=UPI00265A42A0|nr:hypothetical protein [Nocardia sp. PE-7]WKG13565.1 hypothetical protein QX204_34335 [Nocardia sp. PE-7]